MNTENITLDTGAVFPVFLNYDEAAYLTGTSISTIRRMIDSGDFPQPVYLQPRTPRFALSELQAWANRQLAKRNTAWS